MAQPREVTNTIDERVLDKIAILLRDYDCALGGDATRTLEAIRREVAGTNRETKSRRL